MSKEQQDAILGKLMREYRDAKEKLVALTVKAEEYGSVLSNFGSTLAGNPSMSFIEGQIIPVNEVGMVMPTTLKYFDTAAISKITDEFRSTQKEIRNFERKLAELGIKL